MIRVRKVYDDDVLMVIKDYAFVKDRVRGKNYSSKEKAKGLKPD